MFQGLARRYHDLLLNSFTYNLKSEIHSGNIASSWSTEPLGFFILYIAYVAAEEAQNRVFINLAFRGVADDGYRDFPGFYGDVLKGKVAIHVGCCTNGGIYNGDRSAVNALTVGLLSMILPFTVPVSAP